MFKTAIERQVHACRNQEFDRLICKMPSGWLIAGEKQVVPGYCLLLPDPVVPHLNGFSSDEDQLRFLRDMAKAGEVLLELTGAARINYEMLGNLEPSLHAHLFPRYDTEPKNLKTSPIWLYDWDKAVSYCDLEDRSLFEELARRLQGEREST